MDATTRPGRKVRVPLSCDQCRSRKLKCDREYPCQNCLVRKEPTVCHFRGQERKPLAGRLQKPYIDGMLERINRLESMVTRLVAQNQKCDGNNSGSNTDNQALTPDLSHDQADKFNTRERQHGVMMMEGNKSVYRGSTHWGDVLEELSGLKTAWTQVQQNQDTSPRSSSSPISPSDNPNIVYGVVKPITREEILATIPLKQVVDKLTEKFFDDSHGPSPALNIHHQACFMQDYETHWDKPQDTSIMWLALLFSMLTLTMLTYHMNQKEPPEYEGLSHSLFELYRLRTVQCLMMGDITKCAPHTLEAMIYNIMAEWSLGKENITKVWMMIALLVRTALQSGYHRDPSNFLEISVFQGETRRRVWAYVYGVDILASFQVGLPNMINDLFSDADAPRNLHEWELDPDMTILPRSRPRTEITPMAYLLAKNNIVMVLGKVLPLLNTLTKVPYEVVLKLDDELAKAFEDIPYFFKMKSLEVTSHEKPSLVNKQIQLEFLYHQTVCILHRKYLVRGRRDVKYVRSYHRCMESAMLLLTLQSYLYREARSEGSLGDRSWYRVSSTSENFILAAMILCLDLKRRAAEQFGKQAECDCDKKAAVMAALDGACLIWEELRSISPEAAKVHQVLSGMLAELSSNATQQSKAPQEALSADVSELFLGDVDPEADVNTMDFGWDAWDSFIEGAKFDDVYGDMLNFS